MTATNSPFITELLPCACCVPQLLKLGAFKKQPLADFVPYAELQLLRVEDGEWPAVRGAPRAAAGGEANGRGVATEAVCGILAFSS